jgi:hypothetical protein
MVIESIENLIFSDLNSILTILSIILLLLDWIPTFYQLFIPTNILSTDDLYKAISAVLYTKNSMSSCQNFADG